MKVKTRFKQQYDEHGNPIVEDWRKQKMDLDLPSLPYAPGLVHPKPKKKK